MLRGVVIEESLKDRSALLGLRLTKTERVRVADRAPSQPPEWTLVHFEAPDGDADLVADRLSRSLREPGWYVDFDTADGRKYVVYPGTIFRYASGDLSARAEAEAHGRMIGVPEAQLDWQG